MFESGCRPEALEHELAAANSCHLVQDLQRAWSSGTQCSRPAFILSAGIVQRAALRRAQQYQTSCQVHNESRDLGKRQCAMMPSRQPAPLRQELIKVAPPASRVFA
jgi:hypothetical protein